MSASHLSLVPRPARTTPGASPEAFARAAAQTPLLTHADEIRLGRRALQGDEAARRELVQANLRLVMAYARRYRASALPYADLVQEGTLGLMRAAERYDPDRGVRFATYATWWIRQAMSEAARRNATPVYLPVRDAQKAMRLRRLSVAGETPADVEAELANAIAPVASLDSAVDEEQSPLRDRLVDPSAQNAFEEVTDADARATVNGRLLRLPKRERQVLAQRYPRSGGPERTYAQIGADMGVSAERVRQLERRALERLRNDPELVALAA